MHIKDLASYSVKLNETLLSSRDTNVRYLSRHLTQSFQYYPKDSLCERRVITPRLICRCVKISTFVRQIRMKIRNKLLSKQMQDEYVS